jgi:hydroxypyruvate reductase
VPGGDAVIATTPPRETLSQLFGQAVEAARGERVLREHSRVEGNRWLYEGRGGLLSVPLPATGRVIVAGAGKAAASLARGLEAVLGDRIDDGEIIVKHGHVEPLRKIRVLEADHPIPGEASLAATRSLVRLLESTSSSDTVLFVLTGGASSLLCLPAPGLSLADKRAAHEALVNSGSTIDEINTVRKRLSGVKGGNLRRRTGAGTVCTLAISDVPGDDPTTIGSAPTLPDATTDADALAVIERHGLSTRVPAAVLSHLRRYSPASDDVPAGHSDFRIVASIATALDACARVAADEGFEVKLLTDRMTGHTHDAAREFARSVREWAAKRIPADRPLLLLAGGETTLPVTGPGKGGRNQEFALVAARELQGMANVALLAAGTDGTDGPTDAAGAFADGSSFARATAVGLDVDVHLERNDAYPLLQALGDLYVSGPTGTNVTDLVLALLR